MKKKQKQLLPAATETDGAIHFSDFIHIQFHLVSRLSERQGEQEVRQLFDMAIRETQIIALVGTHGTLPVRFLSTHGHFDKGHASRLIAGLVDRGLIHNEINPENQRANNLRLTPKGKLLYREIHKLAARTNERWLAALPKDEQVALRRALARLTELLRADENGKSTRATAKRRTGTERRSPAKRAAHDRSGVQ